jgi:lipopolysaccharide/colanic/teichoic acid biosynthesis glycosyltransferase
MPDAVHRGLGALALIVTAPVLVLLAVIVKVDSPGPALYRAERVGRDGRRFRCLKLRTMIWQPEPGGPPITVQDDARITRFGHVLRRFRLDELPQLINVARGEMNLIGPRPEDPRFVDYDNPVHRTVFTATPGITGLAQLAFINEAELLGSDQAEADRVYRESILPRKVALDAQYLSRRSWRLDMWILGRTLLAVVRRTPAIDESRVG